MLIGLHFLSFGKLTETQTLSTPNTVRPSSVPEELSLTWRLNSLRTQQIKETSRNLSGTSILLLKNSRKKETKTVHSHLLQPKSKSSLKSKLIVQQMYNFISWLRQTILLKNLCSWQTSLLQKESTKGSLQSVF